LHLSWFPIALLDAMFFHVWHQKRSTVVNIEDWVSESGDGVDVLRARLMRRDEEDGSSEDWSKRDFEGQL
jgi:hypothetical protein